MVKQERVFGAKTKSVQLSLLSENIKFKAIMFDELPILMKKLVVASPFFRRIGVGCM
jgi:hypothetical protein